MNHDKVKFSDKNSDIKKTNFSPKNLLIGLFNKHGHTPETSPYGSGQSQFHFFKFKLRDSNLPILYGPQILPKVNNRSHSDVLSYQNCRSTSYQTFLREFKGNYRKTQFLLIK